jgi:hypothetical protein
LSASTSTAGSYSIAASASVAGGYGGAFTSTASTASPPTTSTPPSSTKPPATTSSSGSVRPMPAPRGSLRAELAAAAEEGESADGAGGMNRAERRRLEAQKRKAEKRR